MSPYLDSISNILMERTAEELIAGVFLALLLSLAAAGAYLGARRKLNDAMMVLTVVVLVANLAGMLLAAGYVRMAPNKVDMRSGHPLVARPRAEANMARDLVVESATRAILAAADADRNGRLSREEAAAAATRFVEAAEAEAGRPAEEVVLNRAIRKALAQPDPNGQRGSRPDEFRSIDRGPIAAPPSLIHDR